MVVLIILLSSYGNCVYGSTLLTEDIIIPNNFTLLNNGKEEFLFSALQLVSKEGGSIIDNWDNINSIYKEEFKLNQDKTLTGITESYANEVETESDIGNIILSYYNYLDMFKKRVLESNLIEQVSKVFDVANLTNQYFTYMPIRAITSVTSKQYKFKKYQTTDSRGYRRYEDAYCIALGTYYDVEIGNVYEISFEDGRVIRGVLADVKSDLHTNPTHQYSESSMVFDNSKGNVVEFVMDDEIVLFNGLSDSDRMQKINNIIADDFNSDVIKIKKVGRINVLF